MASPRLLRIETQDDDYVIRVRRDSIDPEIVSRFFEWLLLEAGSRKFDMSGAEIATFADEVDRAAWERIRPMVEKKLRDR